MAEKTRKPYRDISVFDAKRTQIKTFLTNHPDLTFSRFFYHQRKLLLIDDATGTGVSDHQVQRFLAFEEGFSRRDIEGHCWGIAAKAVHDKIATGSLISCTADPAFSGYPDHMINFNRQDDGSFLAVDFTAGYNIDDKQNRFDVLAIKASTMDSLRERIKELYGGTWEVAPKRLEHFAYEIDFGDAQRRINNRLAFQRELTALFRSAVSV